MSADLLKLKATASEDVQVISAVLQDAIVPVGDMLWQTTEKSFVLVAQRFCREKGADSPLERICCAVNLSGVERVQTHGIDLADQDRMLDLLMISLTGEAVHFVFAGKAEIRVKCKDWAMIVEDFGSPWPSACNPCHEAKSAG